MQRRSRIIKIIYNVNRHTPTPHRVKEQVQSNCGAWYCHVAIIKVHVNVNVHTRNNNNYYFRSGRKMMTHQRPNKENAELSESNRKVERSMCTNGVKFSKASNASTE